MNKLKKKQKLDELLTKFQSIKPLANTEEGDSKVERLNRAEKFIKHKRKEKFKKHNKNYLVRKETTKGDQDKGGHKK